jgi:sugar lactone lactonase YvrE
MTKLVFTEFLGGRVFEVEDLAEDSLGQVGDRALDGPSGPAIHPGGDVLVAEFGGHRVALAESGGGWQRFGIQGTGEGEFDRPAAVAFLGDALLVLDSGNGRLVLIDDIAGNGWTTYGHLGRPTATDPAVGAYADPRGLAVDSRGRIWVSDPGAGRVTRVDDLDGNSWVQFGVGTRPYGIAALGAGVAVVDAATRRVFALDVNGAPGPTLHLADSIWTSPAYVAGAEGRLVVADVVANALRLLATDGTVERELRGTPPRLVQPLFDSLGGVAS